jgi:hypothetical protein
MTCEIISLAIGVAVFLPGIAAKVISKGLCLTECLEGGVQIAGIAKIRQTMS